LLAVSSHIRKNSCKLNGKENRFPGGVKAHSFHFSAREAFKEGEEKKKKKKVTATVF